MPNVDLGGIYSQLILDMTDFLRETSQAQRIFDALQKQVDDLSRSARNAARSFDTLADSMRKAYSQAYKASPPPSSAAPPPPSGGATSPSTVPVAIPTQLALPPPVAPQKLLPPGQPPTAIPVQLALPPGPAQALLPQYAASLQGVTAALAPFTNATTMARSALAQMGTASTGVFQGLWSTLQGSAGAFVGWAQSVSQSISNSINSLFTFKNMLIAWGAIRIGKAIFDSLAEFDQKMAQLRSVAQENTGFTAQSFDALREAALRMGATTIYGASQAAEGMAELGRAGFGTNDVLQMIGPTLKVASIEHLSLGRAAEIVTATIHQFGLSASDAQRVTDVLARGSVLSSTSVQGLGVAMSYAGNLANLLGLKLEDTTAIMAALTQGGIDGQRAGTGLRAVFDGLVKETPKHAAELQKLGLTYDQVNPAIVGMVPALQRLDEAFKLNQVNPAIESLKLMRSNGATALATLLQFLPTIIEFNNEMNSAAGTTDRMAATATNNLRDAMTQLGNVIDVAIIKIGDQGLTGTLRGMIDGLTNGLRVLIGFYDPLAQGAEKAYAMAESLKAIGYAIAALIAIVGIGGIGALLGGGPLLGAAVIGGVALAGMFASGSGEAERFNAILASTNTLLEESRRLSEESTQAQIDAAIQKNELQAAAYEKEIENLKLQSQSIGFWTILKENIGGLKDDIVTLFSVIGRGIGFVTDTIGEAIDKIKVFIAPLQTAIQWWATNVARIPDMPEAKNPWTDWAGQARQRIESRTNPQIDAYQKQLEELRLERERLSGTTGTVPPIRNPVPIKQPYGLPGDFSGLETVPARFLDSLLKYAEQYNLDATLLAAQIKNESNWNPGAISPAGAQGLTQFTPDTWKTIAIPLGLKNPFDPEQSMHAQAAYMRQLLDKFGGDPVRALRAYNAGPTAEAKGRAATYAETANYVRSVMADYASMTQGEGPLLGKMGPMPDANELRKQEQERQRQQREDAQVALATLQNTRREQEAQLNLEEKRQAFALDVVRQSGDAYAIAVAEGEVRKANIAAEIEGNQRILAQALATQASGVIKDQSDQQHLAGLIQELTLKGQLLSAEQQQIALDAQRNANAALYRQTMEQIRTEQERITAEARHQAEMTSMQQEIAMDNLRASGETPETIRIRELENQIAAARAAQSAQGQQLGFAAQEYNAVTNLGGSDADILRAKTNLDEAVRASEEAALKTQVLENKLRLAPTTFGTLASDAVQKIMQAFLQGGQSFGETLKGIGGSFVTAFSGKFTAGIENVVSDLSKKWEWLQGKEGLVGTAIGAAFIGIGSLLDNQKATVESLGESVKDNITQTEQQRGLIAGERQIAIAQLNDQLAYALQPTNQILLRIESAIRAAFPGAAGAPMSPAMAYNTYGQEVIGSVRLS